MVAADTHAEQCIPRLTTSTDSSARCADLSSPDCGNPEGEEHGDKGFISQRNYDCYPPLATEAESIPRWLSGRHSDFAGAWL